MSVEIDGKPEEIAALILAVQGRQDANAVMNCLPLDILKDYLVQTEKSQQSTGNWSL